MWGGAPRALGLPKLSAHRATLGDMTGQAVIPAWVSPEHGHIVELHVLVQQLAEVVGTAEHLGQLAAVEWVTKCRPLAPVTHRDEPRTRDNVRAEALVALHTAAEGPTTLHLWWPLVGLGDAYYLPAVERDPEFAYGVWRTLAWITGTRPDPPVELPERDADGRLLDGPRYATRPDPSSPVWQAAQSRRRHRARLEAQDQWDRVSAFLAERKRQRQQAQASA